MYHVVKNVLYLECLKQSLNGKENEENGGMKNFALFRSSLVRAFDIVIIRFFRSFSFFLFLFSLCSHAYELVIRSNLLYIYIYIIYKLYIVFS